MTPITGPALRDIHLPPAPGWWPLAPGWWLLLALLLLAAGLTFRWWARRRPRRQRWRVVERELQALLARQATDDDPAALAAGLSQLLRRAARLRQASAGTARAQAWQAMLRQMAPAGLDTRPLLALESALYQPRPTLDVPILERTSRAWLRHVVLQGQAHA